MFSDIRTESDLQKLHVYPLKRDYYGYENVGEKKLTKFTIGQVEQKIRDAFQPSVFVDPAIISGVTSVIVVPDHYGFLPDKIADEIQKKNRKYYIVPFTHVLHPGMEGAAFQELVPPANAAVLYEIEQLELKKSVPVPPRSVQISFSSPKQIRQLLRRNSFYAAQAPDMEEQEEEAKWKAQPPPARRRSSLSRSTSFRRSTSLDPRPETSHVNDDEDASWEARKQADRQEYDRAWEKMRTRARSLTRQ